MSGGNFLCKFKKQTSLYGKLTLFLFQKRENEGC